MKNETVLYFKLTDLTSSVTSAQRASGAVPCGLFLRSNVPTGGSQTLTLTYFLGQRHVKEENPLRADLVRIRLQNAKSVSQIDLDMIYSVINWLRMCGREALELNSKKTSQTNRGETMLQRGR